MDHHDSIWRSHGTRGWPNRGRWRKAGFSQTDNALDSVAVRLGQHDLWLLRADTLRCRNRFGSYKHVPVVGCHSVVAFAGRSSIEKNMDRFDCQLPWDVDGVLLECCCGPFAIQFLFSDDRYSHGHRGWDVERRGVDQFASGQAFRHAIGRRAFFSSSDRL